MPTAITPQHTSHSAPLPVPPSQPASAPTAITAQHISHAAPLPVPTPAATLHAGPSKPASVEPSEDAPMQAPRKIRKLAHGTPAGAAVEPQDKSRATRPSADGSGNDAGAAGGDACAADEEEEDAIAQQMDKMVVASLLELMHAGSAPGRSKKRSRDPASGGGGSARKKTAGKKRAQSQGDGKSPLVAAEGSGFDPSMKKPQFDVASSGPDAAGGGPRADDAASAELAALGERSAGSVHPSPTDTDAVMEDLRKAEAAGEINPNSSKRLKVLHHVLHSCYEEGLLTYETPSQDPSSARLSPEACILGWSKLLVKQPQQLNLRIRQMVEEDQGGIWKKANGKYNQALKNPTWGVYELFRKIGAKPRFRGPAEGNPGKNDMFYYKEWEFKNDESFRNARQRLAKGFSYCPEKGSRARKRAPKGDLS